MEETVDEGRVSGECPPSAGGDPFGHVEAMPGRRRGGSLELVRAAQGGNSDAAEVLFEHYRAKLYGIAQARFGSGRQSVEVSVVLQTTLRRAVRSLSTLRPVCDEAVDAWFLQILDHAVLDHLRRRHAQRRGEGRATLSLEQSGLGEATAQSLAHPHSEEGTQGIEKDELATGVWRLLSAEERALVRERVIEGASWERVAQVVGAASAEAARKRFEALRKKVQGQLGPDFGQDSLRST